MTKPVSHDATSAAFALDELRRLESQLEASDFMLLETLRARLECCARIAYHKDQHGMVLMQPLATTRMKQRAGEFSEKYGIDPEFLQRVYSLIFSESDRIERQTVAAARPKIAGIF